MVEHFAKLENYEENAPLSELISLERQLSWSAKLSLSELEEFFEPSNAPQPPAPQLQPPPQYSQQPPPSHHDDRDLHSEHVQVALLHRTRNAQGCEWQMVASKEEIRVTRNRGKLFKVVVESSAPFTRNDVHLFLADSSVPSLGSSPAHGTSSYDPSSSSSSPSTSPPASSPLQLSAHDLVVQSIDEVQPSKTTSADGRPTSYSVEVKVKLCLIGKGIQIAARITPPHGRAAVGRSVEFMTHNNGKQKLRTEAKKKKEKEKTTTTKTKKRRSGSKLSRVDGSDPDSHQELPISASAAATPMGLKVEPDLGGVYDLPERHVGTPIRGSSTDCTGEMSSSGSDEDELRHRTARVPLVAPSFYSVSAESQHQQPTGQHHTMATPQQPYSGVAGGFERSETPTMARRQYDGMTPRGSLIDASGEMDIGRVTVVGDSGGPSHHPAAYFANDVGGGLHMEPEAAAGLAMGGSADMAHGAMGMSTGMGMDGGGGMFLPNDGSYGGGVGNAEDLSDYARGEPMFAPGLLNRHAGRKRKMDGMHGGGGGGGGRGSSPYPDHLSIRGGLHVEGIVRAQGFMQYSDLRLKTNVEDIVDAVSLISKLQGKRYRWKSQEEVEQLTGKSTPISLQNNGGLKVIGLIAQQVQQVLPEVVREDEDGFLSVDYVEIIPVLIEAFNQHLEVYHREQKELKSEFDTWRRLLGDKDTPSTEKKSAESSSTMLKELIMVKKQPGGKTAGLTRRARNDSSGSEADLEAARSPIDDEEPDSLDRSSGSTTDGEEDVEENFRHSCTPLTADQVEAAGVAGGAEQQSSDLLAVDLDRLVANKGHLASLAAQMNKLIPDRQYTDLLKYVRDQKKSDRKRNRRLFFLFVFACLALFAINIAVSIGVPFGVTYIAESHV